jgi:hypothetical protein
VPNGSDIHVRLRTIKFFLRHCVSLSLDFSETSRQPLAVSL